MPAKKPLKPKVKPKPKPAAKTKPKPRPKKQRLKEMEKFQQLLLAERERLKKELAEIEERAARINEGEGATELSAYEDHPADLASETFEREKTLAIAENVQNLLARVENALSKIRHGSYGICDLCGRPIPRRRLEVIPFATLCLKCQERLER